MSGLRFSANINWLFTEEARLDVRISIAKQAGFGAVECTAPYSADKMLLQEQLRKHDMVCTLLNAHPGDWNSGDRGMAARPERVVEFKNRLEESIEYAKALDCPALHVMAGCIQPDDKMADLETTYVSNMKAAAERLEKENIVLLIEFVNSKYQIPNYFVDTLEKAVKYIKLIDHPNCKLQMDVYHLQIACGDLTANLKKYMPITGYIQISQAPDRGEPSSAGEINYDYVLAQIEQLGYTGYIGLEYKPTGTSADSLKWMKKWTK